MRFLQLEELPSAKHICSHPPSPAAAASSFGPFGTVGASVGDRVVLGAGDGLGAGSDAGSGIDKGICVDNGMGVGIGAGASDNAGIGASVGASSIVVAMGGDAVVLGETAEQPTCSCSQHQAFLCPDQLTVQLAKSCWQSWNSVVEIGGGAVAADSMGDKERSPGQPTCSCSQHHAFFIEDHSSWTCSGYPCSQLNGKAVVVTSQPLR
mmetsp:Transcript_63318/g.164387  ORF Transcript_63318/g.164387 Transcript_63318/m.164387 type:complete len:208 (+) Transcript_63318:563-1186(+)